MLDAYMDAYLQGVKDGPAPTEKQRKRSLFQLSAKTKKTSLTTRYLAVAAMGTDSGRGAQHTMYLYFTLRIILTWLLAKWPYCV